MSNTTELPTAIEDMAPGQEHSFVVSEDEKEMKQQASAQAPVVFKVKAPITSTQAPPKIMTAAQFVEEARKSDTNLNAALNKQGFRSEATAQVISKSNVPLKADPIGGIDYTKIREEDIYNNSIPIEAKPFAADDSLRIVLKDQNYAPRWVNKNPILLGKALAAGFTYITDKDLAEPLDVAITEDVNGRFINLDVIAMKCPKKIYFAALKAAFQRAVNTVSTLSSKKAAKTQAMNMLVKEAGAGVADEFEAGKVSFYDASGIEI